jgi:hypothetical protein
LVTRLAIVCIVVALVHTARAEGPETAAEQEFRLGYRALQAGNCVDALAHYRRSLELVQRPRTLFNIATCEEELGQHAAALRDYQAFLDGAESRDASIVVEARARMEALRRAVENRSVEPPRSLPSTIVSLTDPQDAMIEPASDGAPAIGHLDMTVEPGRHAFEIHRDGYRSEHVAIDAQPGRAHELRVNLRPQPIDARLVITGRADASVAIDGRPALRDLRSIVAGNHEIEIAQRGRVVWRRGVQFSPGELVSLDLDAPASGTRTTLRWCIGGFGAASIVGGGILGTLAVRDVRDANVDVHDRGKTRALVADGMFVVGTAALIVAWRAFRSEHIGVDIRRETAP